MLFNWTKLSNKQKFTRSIWLGSLAIAVCVIWYDDILQMDRGRGLGILAASFLGFPIQAVYYGMKWYRERN